MNVISDYIKLITDTLLTNWLGAAPFIIALVWVLVYMLWWLRRDWNRVEYVDHQTKWIFLEVKVDELNEKSPMAMEQVFAALHAIHQNFSWGEQFNGKVVLWVSCEMVSIGGKVSFIFRLPQRFRNLFESAVFAQYPKAEIQEVEDYLRNLPHLYDPKKADFDFWGTQWNKKKDSAYPIRTYSQDSSFEHSAQETFIDPLSNLIEVMSNIQPHELMVWQVAIRPDQGDWKEHTKHLLDKLMGIPDKHGDDLLLKILHFIPDLFARILVETISGPDEGEHKPVRVQEEPPSLMLHRSDVEKMVITAIGAGLAKVSYETRIRGFYLAPKDKFNKRMRIPEIVGAVRNFDDINLNGIKPDIGHTWTDKPYKISEKWERPYLERAILIRKRHFLHAFRGRSIWRGSSKMFLNSEELATIFHFPQVPHTRVSQLEKVHTVKSAPPMDLPIK